ncbi:non-homologous end joining protein Ku [Dongia deserti]|uniref:non-homologous end joining protein Ku n=1 Tax=Dongia deserti TaxID=2268030 RepID=UPI000E652809|nr:Ku protein [Dongia deserti]
MARPFWRGQLRLALVTCPINLTPATTERDKIRFHKLNRETGNRLRMQMIDSETQDVVDREQTVMGYEFEKGKYVTVEQEELDKLKIESSDVIDIERVVPIADIDWLFWEKPYLIEPDARGKGAKSTVDIFATIRDALKTRKVAALGHAVIGRRERPVMIQPRGKGMMLTTLRDPDEIRKPEEAFDDIDDVKVNKENLQMAETLIERLTSKFDLDMFEDRYQEALQKLVTAKQKGKKVVYAEEPERESNVVDITEALRASLRGTAKAANVNARGNGKGTQKKRTARTKTTGKRGKRAA